MGTPKKLFSARIPSIFSRVVLDPQQIMTLPLSIVQTFSPTSRPSVIENLSSQAFG